jgi:3-phenylpropionate/trans-cinnamate dioxygenase ferredoxin reductase subunit
MHFGDRVLSIEGSASADRVVTRNGLQLDCDFVVFGFGIDPVTDVVLDSGVHIDNGIVVDEMFQTSIPDIYAAGDVANYFHPLFGRHIRVEHWQNALSHGATAGRSMAGKGTPYNDIPWFWSDQYDLNLQYAGFVSGPDKVVFRGRPSERHLLAFYLKDSRLQAVAAVNRGRDLRRAMPLISSGVRLDPAKLEDEDVDLRTLV